MDKSSSITTPKALVTSKKSRSIYFKRSFSSESNIRSNRNSLHRTSTVSGLDVGGQNSLTIVRPETLGRIDFTKVSGEYKWKCFQFIIIMCYFFLLTFQFCFLYRKDKHNFQSNLPVVIINYILDLFILMDIYRTYKRYRDVSNNITVKYHYKLKLKIHILWSCFSLLPLEILCFGDFQLWLIFRLNRLLLFIYFKKYSRYLQDLLDNFSIYISPSVSRFIRLLLITIMVSHTSGCLWFLAARFSNETTITWITIDEQNASKSPSISMYGWNGNIFHLYIRSFYWALITLTTVGFGDIVPVTAMETIVAILTILIGACLYGSIIANMTSLINNLEASRTQYQEQITDLNHYLKKHIKDPTYLQEVQQYNMYMWHRQRSITNKQILLELPNTLHKSILQLILKEQLHLTRIFLNVPDVVLNCLAVNFFNRIYIPNDIIYTSGEIANELYVIGKGIVLLEGVGRSKILTSGSFGTTDCILGCQRSHQALCGHEYCDIFISNRQDILNVFFNYPEILKEVNNEALKFNQEEEEKDKAKKGGIGTSSGINKAMGYTSVSLKTASKTMIYRDDLFRQYWIILSLILSIYYALVIPIRIAFSEQNSLISFYFYEYGVDVYFIFDFIFHLYFFSDDIRKNRGTKFLSMIDIRNHYLDTACYFDIITIFPFEIMALKGNFQMWSILRCNRILRLYRCPSYIKSIEEYLDEKGITKEGVFTSLKLAISCIVVSVWITCGWYLVAYMDGWALVDKQSNYDSSYSTHFIRGLYWTFMTLTSVGYGDIRPYNLIETVYSILVMLFGVSFYTAVIAIISALATDIDRSSVYLDIQTESCKQYIEYINPPESIRQAIVLYFDYCWSKMKDDNGNIQVLSLLPPSLKNKAYLTMYGKLLKEVKIFDGISNSCLTFLASILENEIALPNQYIIHKNDYADAMYIILDGSMEVVGDDPDKVINTLSTGQHFGHIAFVLSTRRSANVRSIKISELLVIKKEAFNQLKINYPHDMEIIDQKARAALEAINSENNIQNNLKSKKLTNMFHEEETNQHEQNQNHIILPNSKFRLLWDCICLFFLLYYLIFIPMEICFESKYKSIRELMDTPYHLIEFIMDIMVDLFFVMDMIMLMFYFAYTDLHLGKIIMERNQIKKRYLKYDFSFDLIASFPMDHLFFFIEQAYIGRWLRALRLLRSYRIFNYLKQIQTYLIEKVQWNPAIVGMFKFYIFIGIFCHWVGCFWFYIIHIEENINTMYSIDLATQGKQYDYLLCFYWAVVTMNTVGYGDIHPHTRLETSFTIIVMILGASMYAGVIANMANIVANLDRTAVRHQQNIGKLKDYIRYRDLSENIVERILEYYDQIWKRQKGVDEMEILNFLPHSIKQDILSYLTFNLIQKIQYFEPLNQQAINHVVRHLSRQMYLPRQMIAKKGNICTSIHFITNGTAFVYETSSTNLISTLDKGHFFGDKEFYFQEPYENNLEAYQFCDASILSRNDFNKVLDIYPQYQQIVLNAANDLRTKALKMSSNLASKKLTKMMEITKEISMLSSSKFFPGSKQRIVWETFMCILLIYHALVIPFRMGFYHFRSEYNLSNPTIILWLVFEIVLDFFLLVNAYLNAKKFIYVQDGAKITDKIKIYKHYKETMFIYDLLTLLPIDWISLGINFQDNNWGRFQVWCVCRLLKLFSLSRMRYYVNFFQEYVVIKFISASSNSFKDRILKAFLTFLWVAHFYACCWYFISSLQLDAEIHGWIVKFNVHSIESPIWKKYLLSIYWTFTTMATVGYGDITPLTWMETFFAVIVMVSGATIYAGFIAYLTCFFDDMDSKLTSHSMAMDQMDQYLRFLQCDLNIQVQIHRYYEHLWAAQNGQDENEIKLLLPELIQNQINIVLCHDSILTCSLFNGITTIEMETRIASSMQSELYVNGDHVLWKEQFGQHLSIIRLGLIYCQIDEEEIERELGKNDFFGVAAIIRKPCKKDLVVAHTCELLSISIQTLEEIFSQHESIQQSLQNTAQKMYDSGHDY